jgi:L-lactate dehydrogenase complex protein LldG
VDLFEQNLAAVGGRTRRATASRVLDTVLEVAGSEAVVVVTPELSELAAGLARAGVDARVGTRSHLASEREPAFAGSMASQGDSVTLEDVLRNADCGILSGIAGVSSSGTVIVGPGGGNGGLLASLPERTIVLLDRTQVFQDLTEALAVALERFPEVGGELMLITGPSRTADIEMMSVTGVHGPLGVEVVLVDPEGH